MCVVSVPSWVSLQNKPSTKSSEGKYRGELEVKLTFHCQSKGDYNHGGGLKKRTSSIRNLASVFGERSEREREREGERRVKERERVEEIERNRGKRRREIGKDR